MNLQMKALSGTLIIAGTYLLSKNVFEQAFKKQFNFEFKELPWYLRLAIIVFGDKRKYINKELWSPDTFPMPGNFPWNKKLKIAEPFVGFLLVCLGTIIAIFS